MDWTGFEDEREVEWEAREGAPRERPLSRAQTPESTVAMWCWVHVRELKSVRTRLVSEDQLAG